MWGIRFPMWCVGASSLVPTAAMSLSRVIPCATEAQRELAHVEELQCKGRTTSTLHVSLGFRKRGGKRDSGIGLLLLTGGDQRAHNSDLCCRVLPEIQGLGTCRKHWVRVKELRGGIWHSNH